MSTGNEKKNISKIFNNSYYEGGSREEDYSQPEPIKISPGADDNLDCEDLISNDKIKESMIRLLKENERIKLLIAENEKKKFNKESVNEIFQIITDEVKKDPEASHFLNCIHIFDMVISITGMKYKNLFDLLNINYKQTLIDELNEQFDILDTYSNFKNNMF